MTKRENQILSILRKEPMIAQKDLAQRLGITRSAVAGHIMSLTNKGYIQGKGYIIADEEYATVIGGANIDILGRSFNPLINLNSNPGHLKISAGGVGRNISENLARLGRKTYFIGALGSDNWGEILKTSTNNAGVNIDHCLTINNMQSSSYLSIHNNNGEMNIALSDTSLINSITPIFLSEKQGLLKKSSAIVIDANLDSETLEYICSNYSSNNIFIDPVSCSKASKLLPFLKYIHTIKPNLSEAEILSGIKYKKSDDLSKICLCLHQKGIKSIVISLGDKGVFASRESTQILISQPKTQVINVTGAGDALMAGLVHGFIHDWDWIESIKFGLAAAKITINSDNTVSNEISEKRVKMVIDIEGAKKC